MAAAILWLLSDEASFTTGAFIDVSGGKARARGSRPDTRHCARPGAMRLSSSNQFTISWSSRWIPVSRER